MKLRFRHKPFQAAAANALSAVFRDGSFASDSAMVNFEQVFNTYSPNTMRKAL